MEKTKLWGFFSKEQKINMNGKLKTLKGILF